MEHEIYIYPFDGSIWCSAYCRQDGEFGME